MDEKRTASQLRELIAGLERADSTASTRLREVNALRLAKPTDAKLRAEAIDLLADRDLRRSALEDLHAELEATTAFEATEREEALLAATRDRRIAAPRRAHARVRDFDIKLDKMGDQIVALLDQRREDGQAFASELAGLVAATDPMNRHAAVDQLARHAGSSPLHAAAVATLVRRIVEAVGPAAMADHVAINEYASTSRRLTFKDAGTSAAEAIAAQLGVRA